MNFLNNMAWLEWNRKKKANIACFARSSPNTGSVFYEHRNLALQVLPPALPPTPPAGDGVYKGDGSPDIGTYKWNKKNITYCLVMPDANNRLVDIPNNHDLLVSVNTAFTKVELFTPLRFTKISNWQQADISIKIDGSDPVFAPPPGLKVSDVMAYCRYPGTTPPGEFTAVFNSNILFSEDGKFNFAYNINETILHEVGGHGNGCVHTTNPKDIMYPFYHNDLRPTVMDIYQWQTMYNARNPPLNPLIIDNFFKADATIIP